MDIVYLLFPENEGEIINQTPKIQVMVKTQYLIQQMLQLFQENIASIVQLSLTLETIRSYTCGKFMRIILNEITVTNSKSKH